MPIVGSGLADSKYFLLDGSKTENAGERWKAYDRSTVTRADC